MFDKGKAIAIGETALRHGLDPEYIERMWYDERVEGFEVERLPPRESNLIVIRFVRQPDGVLEMIAEDDATCYFVFHAQLVSPGGMTSLISEAFALLGFATGKQDGQEERP